MIDNFDQIEQLLDFRGNDDFYMLQLIKRRKENPDMKGDSQVIKTVYLNHSGQLTELKEDLIKIAEMFNARIYINLNVKSSKKCLCMCLSEMAKRVANDDFYKPYKIFDSVAGSAGASRNTKWVIDIDWNDIDGIIMDESEKFRGDSGLLSAGGLNIAYLRENYISTMCGLLYSIQPTGEKCIAMIQTKNGVHLISKPFTPKDFSKSYPNIAVHKNNPTLVWAK